jgi:hypothetical protein
MKLSDKYRAFLNKEGAIHHSYGFASGGVLVEGCFLVSGDCSVASDIFVAD